MTLPGRLFIGLNFVGIFAIGSETQTAEAQPNRVGLADFGAVDDGKTDCAVAFEQAFLSGARVVTVPAGRFLVSKIKVPEGVVLEGAGAASVVTPASGAGSPLLNLSAGANVRNLKFSGEGAGIACVGIGAVKNVKIERVIIEDFRGMAIESDHTEDLLIEDCSVARVQRATNLIFSHHVKVLNNTIEECAEHGIQFWGNWQWERKDTSDLQIIGNTIRNGGAGAIWGAGARRVIIAQNLVDGAEDVGIDLEWCEDSAIIGNVVERTKNAGISLFFSCQRIAITGNSVWNNRPISAEEAGAGWWVRACIWLTHPNRGEFKDDTGHRDVAISGNTLVCDTGERRSMWIGDACDNISLSGNALRGGKIWLGGGEEPMREGVDNSVVTATTGR